MYAKIQGATVVAVDLEDDKQVMAGRRGAAPGRCAVGRLAMPAG
jgi:hypothetical protein